MAYDKEAFCHLKGWYRVATVTQAKPCYQTMERQTSEWVDLYARRQSPGNPLPILVDPDGIDDNPPEDGKIRSAVARLSNGRAAGALGMRAEMSRGGSPESRMRRTPTRRRIHPEGIIGDCSFSWSRQSGPTASSPASCSGVLLF